MKNGQISNIMEFHISIFGLNLMRTKEKGLSTS